MTESAPTSDAAQPAHRPSRRNEIIRGSVRVFARQGYAEASISDIAKEVGVVPTAVYYHFAGKEELFTEALTSVISEVDAATDRARPSSGPVSQDDLVRAIEGVWEWIEENPEAAGFLYQNLSGATPVTESLRNDFEQRHGDRAFAYLPDDQTPPSRAEKASRTFGVRLLIRLLMTIQASRLQDGPLAPHDSTRLREATIDIAKILTSR